ncbi:MAG: HU family DNA-binding protein [Deltaproteobacteria bacterium]|nr:HU family DNA-binding protein [Deltaproteobacteria bacterium]MBT4268688.1 HU family DNA-binding protein [Deltaproteobacteria bacterium]MBT4642319.1 HU family DNA-binding protein [Deltaproteobacteria bacterium]MBT6503263.1 HU family DNA-binding protein [Deltaproteobacteria bacterium]MBT6614091.1 HU family DNA-binding protein [Deltaproteobacteria bacterium]
MTKAELVSVAAKDAGITQAATEIVLNSILDSIQDGLTKGQRVTLVGFGTFSVGQRQARKGRNPQTNAVLNIPAAKVAKFKPGKALKEAVNS